MYKKDRIERAVIVNPKRQADPTIDRDSQLFPYYAGYSSVFASNLLSSLNLNKDAVIFDPWNGSGTTTQAACQLGYKSIGQDLNPAMVIVAKASLFSYLEINSLAPLAQSIIVSADAHDLQIADEDPLCSWLAPSSASLVRALEREINNTLVSHGEYCHVLCNEGLNKVTPIAAFFYVALFRVCRRLLSDFVPTNPTWVKSPKNKSSRKRPGKLKLYSLFAAEVEYMAAAMLHNGFPELGGDNALLRLGNSESVELPDGEVDFVVTSPPYCTRIDYAVATSLELAVLGVPPQNFDSLRRSLMGTSTVNSELVSVDPSWGGVCNKFLSELHEHPSKASKTYYFKNHVQYFYSLNRSIKELARLIKVGGGCAIVVQDSYYKDIYNDVPAMVSEMALNNGLCLVRKEDFSTNRSMAGLNRRAKEYVQKRRTTESVLCFYRE